MNNLSMIIAELQELSSYELYRILTWVNNKLDNPQSIYKIINNLKLGDQVQWFNSKINTEQTGLIISNCYKKNHPKITSQISPSSSQDVSAMAALPSIELAIENSRANSYSKIAHHSDVISEPSNKDKMTLSATTIPAGSFAKDHASGKVIDLEISSSRSDLSRALLVGFENNMDNNSSSMANDGMHLEQNSSPVTVRKYSFLAS